MSQAPDPARFEALFQEQLRIEQERSRERLASAAPRQALLWLALAPGWSVARAEACDFPAGNEPVAALFQRLVEQGLAEMVEPPLSRPSERPTATSVGRRLPSVDPVYVLRASVQNQVLAPYEADASGQQELLEILGEIGRRLSGLDSDSHRLPRDLRKWAHLAAVAPYEDELAHRFEAETEQAAEHEDAAELLAWIEIARPLADRVIRARAGAGAMRLALERAARRLELLHRRRVDLQHLTHFMERPEQLAAFDELLDDSGEAWALHYIGAGGVGKTMLIRHLKANVARERGLAVARIDFDYLNPDYPRLAPGLLLWAFAQELATFDESGRGRRYFAHADESLSRLHEELRAGMSYDGPTTGHPLFQRALAAYLDALLSLSGRLLLIVDTCEELAKVHTGGQIPENVTATFHILEALHDSLPALRVIFAGRRPLAHRGAGWRCPAAQDLPERPYLRLHEIRGFPLDEAERYLREDLKVPPHLIQPILRRSSPDAGSAAQIIWEDEVRAPRQDVPRCNPYDLRLFADWALEEQPPSAEMIASASGDQYVELRIIQRLHNPDLEDVLPVIALLGHIDHDMLHAVLGPDAEDTDRLFRDLLEQEWTDYRVVAFESGAGDGSRLVVDVERGMQRRLMTYFQNRDGSAVDGYRQRAIEFLEQRTLHDDLGALDWSDFDAMIRLLDSQPEHAVRWWSAVEKRILDRGYTWAANLLQFLQAEGAAAGPRDPDDPQAPPESPLRPAVLATYAAATLHTASPAATGSVWSQVVEKASEDAYANVGSALKGVVRSAASQGASLDTLRRAGNLVSAARAGQPLDVRATTAFLFTLDPDAVPADDRQTFAALVAGVEAILDTIYLTGAVAGAGQVRVLLERSLPRLRALAQTIDDVWLDWPHADPQDAAIFQALAGRALSLVGRALAYLQEYEEARRWFERSLRETPLEIPPSWPTAWYHWLPPPQPAARIRLEAALALHPALLTPEETLKLVELPVQSRFNADDADTDRLEALLLHLQLALKPGPSTFSNEMLALLDYPTRSLRRPTAPIHRAVPPFTIVAARYRAAHGHVDSVLTGRDAIDPDRDGLENAREAARAQMALARRWRLPRRHDAARRLLADAANPADLALIWALDAYRGEEQTLPQSPDNISASAAWLHAVWRTRRILWPGRVNTSAAAGVAGGWARRELLPFVQEASDPPDPHLVLDLHEVLALPGARSFFHGPDFDPAAWWRDHPHRPEEALRLWLRARVLRLTAEPWPHDLPARLGLRRAATIAFEEGDLLALRLPGYARDLFQQARVWFLAAEDHLGALLCSTAAALTLVPNEDSTLLQEELAHIQENYTRFREQLQTAPPSAEFLPSWETLQEIARKDQPSLPDPLPHDFWRPWLARILLCLRVAAGHTPYTTGQLAPWLGEPSEAIPPDLAHAGVRPSAGSKLLARARRRLVPFLIAFSLLAIFVAALYIITVLTEGVLFWLAILVVSAFTFYVSFRIGRINLWQTLHVSDASGHTTLDPAVIEPRRVRLSLLTTTPIMLFRSNHEQQQTESIVNTPGPVPYRLAELLSAETAHYLQEQHRNLSLLGYTLMHGHILIRARPPLHTLAWEAALAAALHEGQALPPQNIPFYFRREAGDAPELAPPPPNDVSRLRIVRLANDSSTQSLLDQGWRALQDHPLAELAWSSGQEFMQRPSAADDEARVLHLLGEVREGVAGLYVDTGSNQQFQMKQSIAQESAGLPPETMDAQALVAPYPNLSLCVLQAPVEYTLPEPRLDTERVQAMLARAFAAELRQVGVPAVLVIPPLQSEVAMEVLSLIAGAFRHSLSPLSRGPNMMRTVFHARQLIYDHYQSQADGAQRGWELAYDVCLFSGLGWRLTLPWRRRLASVLSTGQEDYSRKVT